MRRVYTEADACQPIPVEGSSYNERTVLPYGLSVSHLQSAMRDFIDFLGFINQQLHSRDLARLESFLMPANFSSIVGEFMNETVPQYCPTLARNQYHNGHPDLIPADMFSGNSVQYAHKGIEIKASRHRSGWQGHNPEAVWLLVFYFDSNTVRDKTMDVPPKPFQFRGVYGARLEEEDWNFSGRSETSRRTITASVNRRGVAKMKENWIYEDLR